MVGLLEKFVLFSGMGPRYIGAGNTSQHAPWTPSLWNESTANDVNISLAKCGGSRLPSRNRPKAKLRLCSPLASQLSPPTSHNFRAGVSKSSLASPFRMHWKLRENTFTESRLLYCVQHQVDRLPSFDVPAAKAAGAHAP